jgi:hypothetical protein
MVSITRGRIKAKDGKESPSLMKSVGEIMWPQFKARWGLSMTEVTNGGCL